jgi:hypothetical protein
MLLFVLKITDLFFALVGGPRGKGMTMRKTDMILKVVVEWLTVLLAIVEVLGSNLDLETGSPD